MCNDHRRGACIKTVFIVRAKWRVAQMGMGKVHSKHDRVKCKEVGKFIEVDYLHREHLSRGRILFFYTLEKEFACSGADDCGLTCHQCWLFQLLNKRK